MQSHIVDNSASVGKIVHLKTQILFVPNAIDLDTGNRIVVSPRDLVSTM